MSVWVILAIIFFAIGILTKPFLKESQRPGLKFFSSLGFLMVVIGIWRGCTVPTTQLVEVAKPYVADTTPALPVVTVSDRSVGTFANKDTIVDMLRKFDPTLGDFEERVSDDQFYEAKDDYKNRVQLEGYGKNIKMAMWIYNGEENSTIDKNTKHFFNSFANLMAGEDGEKWIKQEFLKRPTEQNNYDVYDSVELKSRKLFFHYMGIMTLTLKVTTN